MFLFYLPTADLKRTIAVLLDDILLRLGKLENKIDYIVVNGSSSNSTNSTTGNLVPLTTSRRVNTFGKRWWERNVIIARSLQKDSIVSTSALGIVVNGIVKSFNITAGLTAVMPSVTHLSAIIGHIFFFFKGKDMFF